MAEVLLITVLVVALFYVFFIRPTRSEQRKRERDLNDLRIGDTVLTRGGLIATVVAVETPDDGPMLLSLELADGVVVQARTEAVTERIAEVDVDEDETDDEDDDEEDWDADDADEEPVEGAVTSARPDSTDSES